LLPYMWWFHPITWLRIDRHYSRLASTEPLTFAFDTYVMECRRTSRCTRFKNWDPCAATLKWNQITEPDGKRISVETGVARQMDPRRGLHHWRTITSTTWMETQNNGVGTIQNDTKWKRETHETPPQEGQNQCMAPRVKAGQKQMVDHSWRRCCNARASTLRWFLLNL